MKKNQRAFDNIQRKNIALIKELEIKKAQINLLVKAFKLPPPEQNKIIANFMRNR